MKFALITDTHLGPSPYIDRRNGIMSALSEELLNRVVAELAVEQDLCFLVHLGDVIQESRISPCKEQDHSNLMKAKEILAGLKLPLHFVAGNHDVLTMGPEGLASALEQESLHYSFDSDGYHFVILDCESSANGVPRVADQALEWLREDLESNQLSSLVFTHQSLAEADLSEHKYFKDRPEKCLIENRQEIRDLISKSKSVRAVFGGHLHHHDLNVLGGVPYLTMQALIENFCDRDIPSACYAVIEIDDKGLSVDVRGNQQVSYYFGFNA